MSQFMIQVPDVVFKTRVKTDDMPGYDWKDVTSKDIFSGKRVVLFSLPGAYTPTCSSTHLPGFEAMYNDVKEQGVAEVYCISVNDSFTMNSWFNSLGITQVKPIPDGNAEFTRKMGFLVDKSNLGFGMRSWRYSMVVTDGIVEAMFVEPGIEDNAGNDPFTVSDVDTMLAYLKETKEAGSKSA